MRSPPGSFRVRAPLLAASLILAIVLVVMLAIQAFTSQVYHRQATEEVLRDYAALAADEGLRRLAVEIGYYGYLPALEALRAALATGIDDGGPPLQRLQEMRDRADEPTRRGLELVAEAFVFDRRERTLRFADGRQSPGLLSRLPKGDQEIRAFATVLLGEETGAEGLYVYGPGDSAAPPRQLIGFRVDPVALRNRCADALEGQALLPASLGEGDLDNSVLSLRVLNGLNDELYAHGDRYDSGLTVRRSPPADYVGVVDGLALESAIDPTAAHRLVIGGLPRSRLPLLLSLFALTTGLLVAAIVLVRRERALMQMRSDFVSRVSHELRTPLAQIRMFSETLRLGRVRSEQERARYLEILDREAQRLTGLVENVLQFSKVERGQVELHPRPQPIEPLLQRAADEMKPFLAARDCTLEVEIDADLRAVVDADAVHQSLLNLIDNAVKHGPPRQLLGLEARPADDAVRIAVSDQGPGIPVSDREKVWQPFHRATATSAAGSATGTGIGLAVVRDLVEQQGGRCWIEEAVPQGTRVVLELPACSAQELTP